MGDVKENDSEQYVFSALRPVSRKLKGKESPLGVCETKEITFIESKPVF